MLNFRMCDIFNVYPKQFSIYFMLAYLFAR